MKPCWLSATPANRSAMPGCCACRSTVARSPIWPHRSTATSCRADRVIRVPCRCWSMTAARCCSACVTAVARTCTPRRSRAASRGSCWAVADATCRACRSPEVRPPPWSARRPRSARSSRSTSGRARRQCVRRTATASSICSRGSSASSPSPTARSCTAGSSATPMRPVRSRYCSTSTAARTTRGTVRQMMSTCTTRNWPREVGRCCCSTRGAATVTASGSTMARSVTGA